MSTVLPPTKNDQRTALTRQRLFAASMKLIGERGPDQVSVDEIAAAAGVSKGTVYYNFGSKSELITQLLRYGVELLENELIPHPELSPRDAVADLVARVLDFFDTYPSFTQLLVSEMWRTPSEWHSTLRLLRERLFTQAKLTFDRINEDQEANTAIDPQAIIGLTLGATLVMGLDRQVFHPERDREESVRAIMVIIDGYAGVKK